MGGSEGGLGNKYHGLWTISTIFVSLVYMMTPTSLLRLSEEPSVRTRGCHGAKGRTAGRGVRARATRSRGTHATPPRASAGLVCHSAVPFNIPSGLFTEHQLFSKIGSITLDREPDYLLNTVTTILSGTRHLDERDKT